MEVEAEKIAPPQNTVESIQKELADLAESGNKAIEAMNAYKKNIFKTRGEANKFLKTPMAKEKKMILWVVRKGGKRPCFMVDTPERIKQEKKSHAAMKKMNTWQKSMAMMMTATGIVIGIGAQFMGRARKKKFLELKLEYVKDLHYGKMASAVSSMPSEKIISILQELSGISYQRAEVRTAGRTDVYIWLFGVKRSGIRQDLDLFDIRITIYLKNNNLNKVRHCQFNVFYPSKKYSFSWGRIKKRVQTVVFPWKMGCLGNSSLMLSRLKRSIEYHPKPSRSVKNLYAATNMPKLRKVIPEVEQFLEKLYPQLFRGGIGDYADWTPRKIKKTLDEVLALKNSVTIPEEKPLEIGVDETSRVMSVLISSLEKWLGQKWPMPKMTKAHLRRLSAGKTATMVRPTKGYYVEVLNGAEYYRLIKKKTK